MTNILPFAKSTRYDNAALALSAMPLTMTSREIATLTGKQHPHVCRDIRTMLNDIGEDASKFGDIYFDAYNRQQTGYALDEELSITLVSGYDAKMRLAIVKRWKELEAGAAVIAPAKVLTAADLFIQSAHAFADFQVRCVAIEENALALSNHVDEQHDSLSARLDSVEKTTIWETCPAGAESITYIRKRIGAKHDLSPAIIDEVMRQSLYAPKSAGLVVNSSEYAGGSHYVVYWKKDVTAVFNLFVSQCVQESPARYSHPIITGKFKVKK